MVVLRCVWFVLPTRSRTRNRLGSVLLARVVIVKAEPVPFDDIADAVLFDAIDKTLLRML